MSIDEKKIRTFNRTILELKWEHEQWPDEGDGFF